MILNKLLNVLFFVGNVKNLSILRLKNKNVNKETIYPIRKLQDSEEIPYQLLLLADETKKAIDKYIFDSEIFVMEKNDEIIALYALKTINTKQIEIKNIAVSTDLQGKDIGSFLLKDAFERAKDLGFQSLLIGTGDASLRQLALYQREGFTKYEVINDFFIDNYPEPIYENGMQLKDMIVLEKKII
jgi:N-acetylglutamate synthase-like GNAT family acetyltransferase